MKKIVCQVSFILDFSKSDLYIIHKIKLIKIGSKNLIVFGSNLVSLVEILNKPLPPLSWTTFSQGIPFGFGPQR